MDERQAIAAANDTDFHASRHRTLPILASVTPIANYPTKLRIFKTNASRYWQVRCFIKGRTYTQSLKTTHKQAAISAAKQFFHIKVADLYGEHIRDRGEELNKFAELVQAALAFQQGRVQRSELSAEGLAILRNRLQKDILPFFGEMPVDRIGYQQVSDYIQLLGQRELSSVTIQQHLVAIRKILHYAVGVGKLKALPKFPPIKVNSKPRGSFSVGEYLLLVRTARRLMGQRIAVEVTARSRRAQGTVDRYGRAGRDLPWLNLGHSNGQWPQSHRAGLAEPPARRRRRAFREHPFMSTYRFSEPTGLALGPDGTLLVTDVSNARIRAISAGGMVSTLGGSVPAWAGGAGRLMAEQLGKRVPQSVVVENRPGGQRIAGHRGGQPSDARRNPLLPDGPTLAEIQRLIADEVERWVKVIQTAGIRLSS